MAAVNDAAAITEELSASIQEIAATANNLAPMADQASTKPDGGRQNVEKAIAQINSVGAGTEVFNLAPLELLLNSSIRNKDKGVCDKGAKYN